MFNRKYIFNPGPYSIARLVYQSTPMGNPYISPQNSGYLWVHPIVLWIIKLPNLVGDQTRQIFRQISARLFELRHRFLPELDSQHGGIPCVFVLGWEGTRWPQKTGAKFLRSFQMPEVLKSELFWDCFCWWFLKNKNVILDKGPDGSNKDRKESIISWIKIKA